MADVIETADAGPWIAFDMLTSLPPQVGAGIPLSSFDWQQVEGEDNAADTTWTTHSVELVGTWDGDTFTLTERPTPAVRIEEELGTPTEGCDPSRWGTMLDGLFRANVGIYGAALNGWDGQCGVYIDALVDSPELRQVLEPFGDAAYVTYALQPAD